MPELNTLGDQHPAIEEASRYRGIGEPGYILNGPHGGQKEEKRRRIKTSGNRIRLNGGASHFLRYPNRVCERISTSIIFFYEDEEMWRCYINCAVILNSMDSASKKGRRWW